MTQDHHTPPVPQIFDRHLLRQRQNRAAANFNKYTFLHQRIIEDIVDRLETVTRNFDRVLITGPGGHLLNSALTEKCGVGHLFEAALATQKSDSQATCRITLDEEQYPFAPHSFDLVVSIMSLHMINDLPGTILKIKQSLKPDGLFIAAVPGENSLTELRACLYQAETEISGGVSPRVVPFSAIRDLGALLQRAGFNLPVADITSYPVIYRDPRRLLSDLRGMGETNVLLDRKKSTLRKDLLQRALAIYQEGFSDNEGVRASFDIVVLTGWCPHHSQQKPLQPGSANSSLESAIKASVKESPPD